jgi:hypothetical protein
MTEWTSAGVCASVVGANLMRPSEVLAAAAVQKLFKTFEQFSKLCCVSHSSILRRALIALANRLRPCPPLMTFHRVCLDDAVSSHRRDIYANDGYLSNLT